MKKKIGEKKNKRVRRYVVFRHVFKNTRGGAELTESSSATKVFQTSHRNAIKKGGIYTAYLSDYF